MDSMIVKNLLRLLSILADIATVAGFIWNYIIYSWYYFKIYLKEDNKINSLPELIRQYKK